jgi:hypothetical protein
VSGFAFPTEELSATAAKAFKDDLDKQTKSINYGLVLVSLNQHQDKFLGKLVRECGYRDMTTNFKSGMHGNCITLYGFPKEGEGHEIPVTGLYSKIHCKFPRFGMNSNNYW